MQEMTTTMALPRARTLQQRVSDALFVFMHGALLFALVFPLTWKVAALALCGYLVRMWAITAGYHRYFAHRYFAHRSFKTGRVGRFVLALLGTTTMQNGPIWWASVHRTHHKESDLPGDPHSPTQRGFLYAHVGWIFDRSTGKRDLSNVSDLMRYPEIRWLDSHEWLPIFGYALLCYLVGGLAGLEWGFVVCTMAVLHATMLINSLAHVWGSRRYETGDTSRNTALLAVLTLGEGWHNNHHHYMSSARQGFRWWELDVTYLSLKVLSWVGIVWDVRVPPDSALGAVVKPSHASPVESRAK